MNYQYPFTDSAVKAAIVDCCDYGRSTGNWNPLVSQMATALHANTLTGPFFFHAEMKIKQRTTYNWCIVEIDYKNHQWLQNHVASFGGYEVIQDRYRRFFGACPRVPNHLPAHILAANEEGNAGDPHQVSWFLDQFLPNINVAGLETVCGLEIITAWQARFEAIYEPAASIVFTKETQATLLDSLYNGADLSATATLAALIHEAGHWVGKAAVLPTMPPFAFKMPLTWFGALGELTTDMALMGLIPDIAPSVVAFTLFYRLFDYTRKGSSANPTRGWLHKDYDVLTGTLLFERFLKDGVFHQIGDRLHIDFDAIQPVALSFLQDLETLGYEAERLMATQQEELIKPAAFEMIARYVPTDEEKRWIFSPEMRRLLQSFSHLPLYPSWELMKSKYYVHQDKLTIADWVN